MYPTWVHSGGGMIMAKEKFDLTKLLGNRQVIETKEPAKEIAGTDSNKSKTVLISIYDLEPSTENFYSVDDVADLKDSIEIFGVKQNLLIEPIPGATNYKIIAGHRRREASRLLVEEGKPKFEFVPCEIETDITETEKEILLIMTNSTTREITAYEKTKQVTRLKELFREYKKTHALPGRIQELIAEAMNISKSQVDRMEKIEKDLSEDFKEEFKNNNITFSAASELARLSAEDQKAVYEKHKETGVTSLNEVREQKKKAAQPETKEVTNPTIQALRLVKELLEKEAAKINIKNIEEETVESEYRDILLLKAEEIGREILWQIDIAADRTGALGEPLFTEIGGGTNERD